MLDEVATRLTQSGFVPRMLVESDTETIMLGEGIECFLFPVGDEWDKPDYMTGLVRYGRTHRFGVLLVIPVEEEADGPELSAIETQADLVTKALAGWQPASASAPVRPLEAGLQAITRGRIWWNMVFETEHELRI
ncbi:MAG: hypothetical protein AAF418_04850 [Pseudomonadota bacterium]